MRRFDVEGYLSYSEKYKVTESGGVPAMIIALIVRSLMISIRLSRTPTIAVTVFSTYMLTVIRRCLL